MPVDDLHVDPRLETPRPAPNVSSPSAPRFASLSTSTWTPIRALELLGGVAGRPSRAGSSPSRPSAGRGRSGPGRPMPAPTTRSRSTPACASTSSTSSRPRCRAPRRRRGRRRPARRPRRGRVDERSATATRTCEWPKSMPSATPADGSSRRSAGGRPRPPGARPTRRRRRSTTRPALWRSATSVADGRAREARQLRELAARRGPAAAQRIDDAQAVSLTQRLEGAVGSVASHGGNLLARQPLLSRAWLKNRERTWIPPRRG